MEEFGGIEMPTSSVDLSSAPTLQGMSSGVEEPQPDLESVLETKLESEPTETPKAMVSVRRQPTRGTDDG